MHPAALEWVASNLPNQAHEVLDIGGRDVNGSPRHLIGGDYTSIDLREGPGVDVVDDVTDWEPHRRFDLILCLEVLEHAQDWRGILEAAHRLCTEGGTLIVTAAGVGRTPHAAQDGGVLPEGEHYGNITEADLTDALASWFAAAVDVLGQDIRAVAVR